jgi:hypothetical protein
MEPIIKDQAEITQLLIATNYFFNYRHFNEALLWHDYINLESIIQDLTYDQYESIRQMIEVEEIVNAIQYCLDLGAIAICVDNRELNMLGHKLAKLKEKNITDFYANIEKQEIDHIKGYMGYHDIMINKNENIKYIRSCKKYQAIISELAQFYNLYYDLYLSYKHGLRIAPLGSKNGKYIYGITDTKTNNYAFHCYEIPPLHGVNQSFTVCDIIKDIFGRLYIPLIRRHACEFLDIKKETLDQENHISRNIKTVGNLISYPTYHQSISFAHPWWKPMDSSLEPFY